ncbi:MAG: hypothetical protein M0R48_08465 [Candidatus Omnitrophica bacterium]|nr:hypothetical protein [Candidatus Omnitrophota bacterium]
MFETSAQNFVIRNQNARQRFLDLVQEQFHFSDDEAVVIFDYYLQKKIIRLDNINGTFILKHGIFWDHRCMSSALQFRKKN